MNNFSWRKFMFYSKKLVFMEKRKVFLATAWFPEVQFYLLTVKISRKNCRTYEKYELNPIFEFIFKLPSLYKYYISPILLRIQFNIMLSNYYFGIIECGIHWICDKTEFVFSVTTIYKIKILPLVIRMAWNDLYFKFIWQMN